VLDGDERLKREHRLTDIYLHGPEDEESMRLFNEEYKGSPKYVEDCLMKLRVELLEITLLKLTHTECGKQKLSEQRPKDEPSPSKTKQPSKAALGQAVAGDQGPMFSKEDITILDLYKLAQLPDYPVSPALGFLVVHAMHMTGMLPQGMDNSMWNKDQRLVFGHTFLNIYRFLVPLYMKGEITDPGSLYAGAFFLTSRVMSARRELQIQDMAEAMVVMLQTDMETRGDDGFEGGFVSQKP